jgi:hypothetical protein
VCMEVDEHRFLFGRIGIEAQYSERPFEG